MTKSEFIRRYADNASIDKHTAELHINTMLNTLKQSFVQGKGVEFREFGTFKILTKPRCKGRNIYHGTEVIIPAHKYPKFFPAKRLRNLVKQISAV